MATSLNSVTEEEMKLLEKEEGGHILYKGNNIAFVYNGLKLGTGSLYITRSKFVWIKNNEENRKVYTDFKNLSKNSIYLNYYERNREIFMHLLNEVNNISIESSNIALHALSSDKKLCNDDCIYVQLNNDIFDTVQNEKMEESNHSEEIEEEEEEDEEEEDENEKEENKQTKKKKHQKNKNYVKCENKEKEDDNDEDEEEEEEKEGEDDDVLNSQIITPEVLLIGGNTEVNEAIFQQLSNFDDCHETESGETDFSEEEEKKENNNSQEKSN